MVHRRPGLRVVIGVAGWLLAGMTLAADAKSQAPHGSVVIKRDNYGVPSIYADDTYSLYYGYGYALAEDRLFQLESTRRSSQGRAAEVFGASYLEKDRDVLTNYDPETLRPQLAALKGEHRLAIDGMVAGINARIRDVLADPDRLLPKQFKDFGFQPERWTDIDVPMSWVGQLLFRFSDYTSQISNTALLSELIAAHGDVEGKKIFATLRWRDDRSSPLTVQIEDQESGRAGKPGRAFKPAEMSSLKPLSPAAAMAEASQSINLWGGTGPDRTPHSSNTWLVNRSRLVDADAVLVSGPQVGDHVPSMIWSASLHGAGLDATGMTYPGLPYLHFGTNGTIAWGRTALAGSIIDVYQEQLNPANPHQYRFKGKWVPMTKRTVTIKVRDGQPVTLDLYSTVHGPVIAFDDQNRTAYAKRRSWAGRELESMFAYYDEMKAQSFSEWSAAIARKSNNQNQYYADRDGNIAYIQAGRYPIRPKDFEIQLPTPGTGEREWLGFQPAADNARVMNPKRGYIANWNNRPSIDVLNTDTLLWSKLNHVDAITRQFDAKPKLTVAEVWDVNRTASYASEQQPYFVPLLRAAVANEAADSRARIVAEAIIGWDGQEDDAARSGRYTSPGVAAYYEWMATALTRFYSRDIPKKYLTGCGGAGSSLNCPWGQPLGAQVLYFALAKGEGGTLIPPFDFLHGEAPAEFIRATLAEADKALSARYGADPSVWLLETKPKTWSPLSPAEVPWSSPDEKIVSKPNQKRGSMNAMYVFKNGKVSMCDATPPGQSGFIAPDGKPDPHYRDQQQLYTSFDCKSRPVTAAEVEASTVSRRELKF
ncbi:penicillin acylase family protein [Steroidobacter flavus]|uniref:Penicillin acylase family protein n=1 Tax=Steroidobacter flavus TaxID=1842136 RepID=A0ABV8SZ08_9GAMM